MLRLPTRAVLALEGADTLALLERTVTHNVADWHENTLRYGGLLTPQGKLIIDYLALRTAKGVWIDVHVDAASDLEKRLKLFRLRAAVDISRREDLCVATCETGAPDPRHADLPYRRIVTLDDSGLGPAMAPEVWSRLTLAAGIPDWGLDYGANAVFPTDVNMDQLGGIDYRKGCFVGQEVASRMKRKGGVRKRMINLVGAGVAADRPVLGPAELGRVTRADNRTGLALMRIDRLAKALHVGAPISCGDAPVDLHFPDWLRAEIEALKTDGHEPLER